MIEHLPIHGPMPATIARLTGTQRMTQPRYFCRNATPVDVASIVSLDAGCFDDPLGEDGVRGLFRKGVSYVLVVDEESRENLPVKGFAAVELGKNHLKVARIAVDPRWRLKGFGRMLLGTIREKCLKEPRRPCMSLEVPETNLGAQLWLRACEVPALASVRGDSEDVILFQWVARIAGSIGPFSGVAR